MSKRERERLTWLLERIRHAEDLCVGLHIKRTVVEAGRLALVIRSLQEAKVSLAEVVGSESR